MSKKTTVSGILLVLLVLATTPLLGTDNVSFLKWWLMTLVLGIGFYPAAAALFPRFHDRGWMFSKVLGIVVSGFAVFALGSFGLVPFTAPVCLITVGVLILASWIFGCFKVRVHAPEIDFLMMEEVLFFAFFLLWTYLAGFHPEAHGTEKFMDYGFMKAMMRSTAVPAEDLWYSGSGINYYYGGQFYAVFLTKITFTDVKQTYHLMRTMVASFTFVLPFSITYHLAESRACHRIRKEGGNKSQIAPVLGGLLSGGAVSLAGNMHYVIYGCIRQWLGLNESAYWFPSSTRYIGYDPLVENDRTIHEFPSYSFVLGDLHAHVVNVMFVLLVLGQPPRFGDWVYRALTFLVISCPCALVISIPLSFFAGLGGAGHEGILIKGSNYLEALSKTKIVVFDKTGTLTQGVFEVTGVHHSPMEDRKLLEYAALAECASSHPISKSLQKACGVELDRSRVTDIEERSGRGVVAAVDGHSVAAGNGKLMDELGVKWQECRSVGTIVHMAVDGEYAGHIVISDVVKSDARDAIAALKRAGVQKTVMLTGDIKKVADHVAQELGVDEVHAELLPGDKVARLERLLGEKGKDDCLAFVGDGINDAPVLSRADIGIAMGAMGSDAAIEAADVVLMDDDPMKIAKGIQISRKCIRIVYENIVFALAVKFACLLLGAIGMASMWTAIFADVGVMVIAVLNATRALYTKDLTKN